jgi:hypothetical protein
MLLLVYRQPVIRLLACVVLLKLAAMMEILVLLILVGLLEFVYLKPNVLQRPMPVTPSLATKSQALVLLLLWPVPLIRVVLSQTVIQSRDVFLLITNQSVNQQILVPWVLALPQEIVPIPREIVYWKSLLILSFQPVLIIPVFPMLDVR